ncbi:DEAD-box ATP-dependent RNA helicase CshA [Symmachiella dynata]|uniref:DEAD-box ATP-dependent RNA helicase CshA n=1 Tax=Symmachiella dynata TaxID=2527995 RepID=A0A517ZJI8_9PLAN|nr:DEAD/DEAH box helicase [Symmachiella dynata]QDU42634.1 DEAD-box ATP-dependent RNA helicase CshA [Symmachiella dynata]
MSNETEKPTKGFADFGLSETTLKALKKVNYETPSPIQAAFIPIAVTGKDCMGQAQTGTGKTASFVLPSLQAIDDRIPATQVLVLTPTRELSDQVNAEAQRLCHGTKCRTTSCVGGKDIRKQISDLKRGAQIAVGTPGRVLDLISRGVLDLSTLKIVILDEADRMLDIGFRPDIEKILRSCPAKRQTLLLSATMPPPVERLARRFMNEPERVDLSTKGIAATTVEQFCVTVDRNRKYELLTRVLFQEKPRQAIVFTRTKRGADALLKRLSRKLTKQIAVIHGDLQQRQRDRVLNGFREGNIRLLIATDVMGRGIDVSGVSHIINYDIPEFCDDYVHRIGRTGRMNGELGRGFTFVTPEEGEQLTNIEIRINGLLEPYTVPNFDAFEPRKPYDPEKAAEEREKAPPAPTRNGRFRRTALAARVV